MILRRLCLSCHHPISNQIFCSCDLQCKIIQFRKNSIIVFLFFWLSIYALWKLYKKIGKLKTAYMMSKIIRRISIMKREKFPTMQVSLFNDTSFLGSNIKEIFPKDHIIGRGPSHMKRRSLFTSSNLPLHLSLGSKLIKNQNFIINEY